MLYIKFCLICLIINLIADIIVASETGRNGRLVNVTVFSFVPLINIIFTLLSLFIVVTAPFARIGRMK